MSASSSLLTDVSLRVLLFLILLFLEITAVKVNRRCASSDNRHIYTKSSEHTCNARSLRDSELFHSLKDWDFAEEQLLQKKFDIHPEKVRDDFRGAIFTYSYISHFSTLALLAAYSEDALINILDLNPNITESPNFQRIVSGNGKLKGSKPMSHRYGGHQFGTYDDKLGDGRVHLLGEYLNAKEERWEVQLHGSGPTPFMPGQEEFSSHILRDADGRADIRSSVREFLGSEIMYFLGIPTTRCATLVITNDTVQGERLYSRTYDGTLRKGGIVMRMAQSWFRIGSLETLAHNKELFLLKQLVDFMIKVHFPQLKYKDKHKYVNFYREVCHQTAEMIANWMAVGFVHGRMDTDNFNLLSITMDYAAYAFMDIYDPNFVSSLQDENGRYSYKNQPEVARYNMDKLRRALDPILTQEQKYRVEEILDGFMDKHREKYMELFRKKLGITGAEEEDHHLVGLFLRIMADKREDFTLTFRQLGDLPLDALRERVIEEELWALESLRRHPEFKTWSKKYVKRIERSGISDEERRRMMHKANPRYVMRNWMIQEAVEKAEKHDFSEVNRLLRILENPFEEQEEAETAGYANPTYTTEREYP